MGESVDSILKFVVKGWSITGTLKIAHMMHGMSIMIGRKKKIKSTCKDFSMCNCCQYKEIPLSECQKNVKECKRMSQALEGMICFVCSAGLERMITQEMPCLVIANL